MIDIEGRTRINLVAWKSRVASLKQISIARHELCAAVLLSDLVDKIYKIIPNFHENLERRTTFLHTLSAVVLKINLFDLVGLPGTEKFSKETLHFRGYLKLTRVISWLIKFRNNTQLYFS